jgi:hypothetical protein
MKYYISNRQNKEYLILPTKILEIVTSIIKTMASSATLKMPKLF